MTLPAGWQIQETLAITAVSRTWRVLAGEQMAVLRLDEPGATRLGLNRPAEPAVLRAAAAAGLGPACLQSDADRGLLLTEWLPGTTWSAGALREPGNLRLAAGLLRRVHALPLTEPVLDLGAAIGRYAAPGGARLMRLAARARDELALCLAGTPSQRQCLCHNDPTPGNFIALPDGGLRLIDWEYAGRCYPGFDLAGLALGAGLTPDEDEMLLGAYGDRPPDSAAVARHRAWKRFCQVLSELWVEALI